MLCPAGHSPRGGVEVGGCGEELRSVQESLPPDFGAGGLNYLLNLGLIGVSERYETCQFCAQDRLSRAL